MVDHIMDVTKFTKVGITATINQVFFGGLVLLNQAGIITIDPHWTTWIIGYVAANLISYPFIIKKRMLTPEIASKKCHFCDGNMFSNSLKCDKCGATSDSGTK